MSGRLVARFAMVVIGRSPIDASHRPPKAARIRAIGRPIRIASRMLRWSRWSSERGLAVTSRNDVPSRVSCTTRMRQALVPMSTLHVSGGLPAANDVCHVDGFEGGREDAQPVVQDGDRAADRSNHSRTPRPPPAAACRARPAPPAASWTVATGCCRAPDRCVAC